MRRLTVRHVTVYRYAEPVRFGEHRMRFRPRQSHDLRLVTARLDILPRPAELRWVHDVFDNSVAIATFDDAASELCFDSTVTLEHREQALPDDALEADAQTHSLQYPADESLVGAARRRYPDPAVDRWALQFFEPSKPARVMSMLRGMTLGIKEQLVYAPRGEQGVQAPGETLARGCGSCRDFALLMIEAVRSLGLAARFVSGYILAPHVFAPHVGRSAGATHAWTQVFLPGAGWVDFDPTNSMVGNRGLIRVVVAWDPQQALPLWGSFFGPTSAFRGMEVAVSVIEEAPRALASH